MYRVLIVDDDKHRSQKLVKHMAEKLTLDRSFITAVESIDQARQKLSQIKYNLIILDIVLPKRVGETVRPKGGIELLELIQVSNKLYKPMQIIGITSNEAQQTQNIKAFERMCFRLIRIQFGSSGWIDTVLQAVDYNYRSYCDGIGESCDSVIIALHGIMTYGEWHNRLEELVRENFRKTSLISYKYGFFSVFSFLIPPLRYIQVYLFSRRIRESSAELANKRIYIVAHSFGTYILMYSLKWFKGSFKELNVVRIVLAGSVLRGNANVEKIISSYKCSLVNDCGRDDRILPLAYVLVPGMGMAGRMGLNGLNSSKIVNRIFPGGHGHYFKRNSEASNEFMKTYWLECFSNSASPHFMDCREATLFSSFSVTALNAAYLFARFVYIVAIYKAIAIVI